MSQLTQLLNVEAREFSPLALLKISAYEKSGNAGEKQVLEKLQNHDINKYRRRRSVDDSGEKIVKARILEGSDEQRKSLEFCRFCRSNGEKEDVYTSHRTKRADGVVECPILRNFICPK